MSLTYEQAVDEMVRLFTEKWNADTPALNGGQVVPVLWPGNPSGELTPVAPHARHYIRHIADPRHTLAVRPFRRFTRSGYIFVRCLTPIADYDASIGGLSLAEKLAIIARDAYEGVSTTNSLWFRNARIVEVGAVKAYYEQQARVDFTYDECK